MKNSSPILFTRVLRLGLFTLAVLVMAICGYWYNLREVTEIKNAKNNELQTISKLKVGQIADWRNERRKDAQSYSSGILRQEVLKWGMNAFDPASGSEIKSYLEKFREIEEYQNMFIAAPDGRILISLDPSLQSMAPQTKALVAEVASARDIKIGDIFLHLDRQHLFLDVAAPILDTEGQAIAVLILRSDPESDLFPIIRLWPIDSKSAETLLIRQYNGDVLFLNVLRHRPDPALTMRIPLTQTDVPAVQAVLGRSGIFEGKDYRGVDVVSDIRAVPNSPWFMIAKVDASEVFAEAYYRTSVILLMIGLGILLTGIMTAFASNRQHKNIYKRLYIAEHERREAQEETRAALYSIGDGVLTTDSQGCVTRMNPVAELLTGWNEADALGKPLKEIFNIVNEETRNEVENPVLRVLREGRIVGLANHTLLIARGGVERPIADSAAPIATEAGLAGVALVFRDQTKERAVQKMLMEREVFARSVLDAIGAIVVVLDRYGVIQATNSAWRQFAQENGADLGEKETGIGVNYLDVTAAATGPSSEGAAEALAGIRSVLDGSSQEFTIEYPCHSPSTQRWFMLRVSPLLSDTGGAVLAHIDITYRTMLEMRRELAIQVLARLNQNQDTVNIVGDILQLIKDHTGIEAVGIRLHKGEDFPYQEALGFPDEFIEPEQTLCSRDQVGNIIYDADGSPMLECLCGDVLSCRIDSSRPYFSPKGSFWVNSTTKHIASASETDRKTPLRGKCVRHGFESLALIPVRVGNEIMGLIHLADHRKEMFTPELIGFFEGIGSSIGIALTHRQTSDEIRINRERLEKSQEVGRLGCWEYDMVTNKIWASKEGYRIFGLTPAGSELPIEQIEACIPERERVHKALIDLMNEGKEYSLDYVVTPADGSEPRFIHSKAELARDDQGQPLKVTGVIQDITTRKKAEDQVQAAHLETQRLLEEAERSRKVLLSLLEDQKKTEAEKETLQGQFLQAQKMESVGRLAGGVAHDFNNMLQVILGHSAIAMEQIELGQPIHDHLQEIQDAAQRSADLTRQLLAFARKQTIVPKVLDLNQTVFGMLKMLQRLIGENIDLVWKPGPDLRSIRMDPSQIDQVLANLSVNARDAITGTGNLTIETHNVSFDETYCATHAGFIPGEYVMLAVSDTGVGMNKVTIDQLFEPFFTTKELGKGTGLGLATVYGIVKQNNGFINVYSEPGQGTAIKVYLPSLDVTAIETETPDDAQPVGGTEMVLIVEDETPILTLAKEILQNYGYTVLAAATPSEALDLAKRHKGLIALLITDVVMPQMNGRDLKELIVPLQPGIKTLYMSGYTANVIAHHGVIDEGVEFLQKPFSVRKLAHKVRQLLDKK